MASVQDAPIQATYLPPLISYVVMFALGTSVLHYLLASSRPNTPKTVNNEGDHPPLIPYVIPLLGNLPLSFLRDPLGFSFTYVSYYRMQAVTHAATVILRFGKGNPYDYVPCSKRFT
jgi:hypothetical protein